MQKINQSLAVILSGALALTSIPLPAGATAATVSMPSFASRLAPSERLGYIASSYAPTGDADRPRLIVISDLHGHLDVQRNIMGILDSLVGKIGGEHKKVPIFVEGGWQPNLEEPLRNVSDKNTRAFLREYFLQKAEMGAAQAYSEKMAGSGKVTLIGVENEIEYKANKAEFAKTYPQRKQVLVALKREEAALRKLSRHVLSQSFLALQKLRNGYFAGTIPAEAFAKVLVHQAARLGIDNRYINQLKNVRTTSADDLDVAFAETYRLIVARLSQSRPVTSFLRKSLENESDLRQKIARLDAQMDLLKRLVGNQLTPGEVPLALARMPELVAIAESLMASDHVNFNVGDVVRKSLCFYPYAILRDESLVKNSLKSLDSFGSDATGILVVGGFHAGKIDEYLQNHRIAYLHINPSVRRDLTSEEQLNYVKRMCDEHITPTELDADISYLRGHSRGLDSDAMGPTTSASPEAATGETSKEFMGGLTAQQLAMLAQRGNVLAGMMSAMPLSYEKTVGSTADSLANISAKLEALNTDRVSKGKTEFKPNIGTLQLGRIENNDGKWTYVGKEGSFLEASLNEVSKGAAQKYKAIDVVILSTEDEVKALGGEGAVLGIDSERAVMVLSRANHDLLTEVDLTKIDATTEEGKNQMAAVSQAIFVTFHELKGHLLNRAQNVDGKDHHRGTSELAGVVDSIGWAAAIAVKLFAEMPGVGSTQAAAEIFLNAIEGQVVDVDAESLADQFKGQGSKPFANWKSEVPTLALVIANAIKPGELDAVQVQGIINDLQKRFPLLGEDTIRIQLQQEQKKVAYLMLGDSSKPGYLRTAVGGILSYLSNTASKINLAA